MRDAEKLDEPQAHQAFHPADGLGATGARGSFQSIPENRVTTNESTGHGIESSTQHLAMHPEATAAATPPVGANPAGGDGTSAAAEEPGRKPPLFVCDRQARSRWGIDWTWSHGCKSKSIWPHKCTSLNRYWNSEGKKDMTTEITCGFDRCSKTFKTFRAFDCHYRSVHARAAKLDCTFEGCPRVGEEGFTRKDNLTQHLRSVHGEVIPMNPFRFGGN